MTGYSMQDTRFTIHDKRNRISCAMHHVLCILLILASCILHLASDVYADTIRVLILDEDSPRIPAKNEPLEKVSEKIKGDFFTGGVHYRGELEIWKGKNGLYVVNEIHFEEYQQQLGMKWLSWQKKVI